MSSSEKKALKTSSPEEVSQFLQEVRSRAVSRPSGGQGRLIFAMDATASREPMWDRACQIQGHMFEETAAIGGLEIQLAFYRGYGEFKAAPWASDANVLLQRMTAIRCAAGQTQIKRVLQHTIAQAQAERGRINALVFVGDCMEEDPDGLAALGGELGILGVPMFLFQDGGDPIAAKTFSHLARLTRGAHCRFDASSASQLKDLLCAVAVYAAGGYKALAAHGQRQGGEALQLLEKLSGRT